MVCTRLHEGVVTIETITCYNKGNNSTLHTCKLWKVKEHLLTNQNSAALCYSPRLIYTVYNIEVLPGRETDLIEDRYR